MVRRGCVFLCVLFLLTGCLQKTRIADSGSGDNSSSLVQEASQAWKNKDYANSARLYQRLLIANTLRPAQIPSAWQKMTYSALYSKNYTMAMTGLRGWSANVSDAGYDPQWIQAEFLVNTHFAPHGQHEAAKDFLLRQDIAWRDKTKVIDFVFTHLWQEKKYLLALTFTRLLYAFSPAKEQKPLQTRMIALLQELSPQELGQLEAQDTRIFPDNCLTAVQALVQLTSKDPAKQRQAYEDLLDLSHLLSWQGDFPFQRELKQLKKQFGRSRQELALLLPLSGGYAEISEKILQGVEIGLQFLSQNDFDTHVRIINSESDNWIEQIRNLPPSVTFIGGPLRKQIWQQIVDKKLYQRHAFFTFLSHIQEEGFYGWRFFSSPGDQIRSLLKACTYQQPDMNFAILYPDERYGQEMSRIFSQELQKNGLQLKAMQTYTPGRHKSWGQAVARLLNIRPETEEEEEQTRESEQKDGSEEKQKWQPDFEAVFLPDSFAAARQLIPGFFYNDAGNLLFLGPQLWEEGLTTRGENKYFSNSLFPSAWWRKNPSYPARFLDRMLGETRADFWAALGFDFARFFTRMPAPGDRNHLPEQVNSVLPQRAQKMDWTLAPLLWDNQGRSKQEMYIFRASSRQTAPLDTIPEPRPFQ